MGSSPQQAKPAKFIPTDIPKTASLVEKYNNLGYNAADADMLARFPGLVAQRDVNISDAVSQAGGNLDPAVENQFATDALSSSLSAFGGAGNPAASLGGIGSAGRSSAAASIANQTTAKEDYDRQYQTTMFSDNPERAFTLSGPDAVNLAINNVIGANQSKYQAYAGNVAQGNAQNAAQTQEEVAGASLAISLLGALAAFSDRALKTDIAYTGDRSTDGIPIAEYTELSTGRRMRGVIAQDVLKSRPDAVTSMDGYLAVFYGRIGVKKEAI